MVLDGSQPSIEIYLLYFVVHTFGYSCGLTNRPSMPSNMTDIRQMMTPNSMMVLHTGCEDCITLK